jgi:hypothetical protein
MTVLETIDHSRELPASTAIPGPERAFPGGCREAGKAFL